MPKAKGRSSSPVPIPVEATRTAQRRYDRVASVFDLSEIVVERVRFRHWRRRLWAAVQGRRILEVGVGTGKNLPYHPPGLDIAALDISPAMLRRARARARRQGFRAELLLGDGQMLPFADASLDGAAASFVFCSVPDAVRGLAELGRVVRPGGTVVLLEHVISRKPILGWLMNRLNPLVVRLAGANINRDTVENVEKAGLEVVRVDNLFLDIVKLIVARHKLREEVS